MGDSAHTLIGAGADRMAAPRWRSAELLVALLLMKAQALHGHLDALLLAVLESGALHGYAIIEELRARSGGVLSLPTGTIYPALRRLERAGFVESEWSTVNGRERRTYRLTGPGQRALAGERTSWGEFSTTVGRFLGTDAPPQAPA